MINTVDFDAYFSEILEVLEEVEGEADRFCGPIRYISGRKRQTDFAARYIPNRAANYEEEGIQCR